MENKHCITCHFFKRTHEQGPWEINQTQRDKLKKRESDLAGDFSYGCYMKVWDGKYCCGRHGNDLYDEILQKERKDCFFWPFQPGMLFPAAETLQKREAELKESATDRKHTKIGLFIAAIAIVANAIISLVDLLSRK